MNGRRDGAVDDAMGNWDGSFTELVFLVDSGEMARWAALGSGCV